MVAFWYFFLFYDDHHGHRTILLWEIILTLYLSLLTNIQDTVSMPYGIGDMVLDPTEHMVLDSIGDMMCGVASIMWASFKSPQNVRCHLVWDWAGPEAMWSLNKCPPLGVWSTVPSSRWVHCLFAELKVETPPPCFETFLIYGAS